MNWIIVGTVLLADQIVKVSIAHNFTYGEMIQITPFFNLVYYRNSGAAFGMLADAGGWQRYLLTALALGVSVWLVWMLRQKPLWLPRLSYCLVLGGALGNVADRIIRGQVVDFLDFHYLQMHWPAFNLADTAIFLGVFCLIVDAIKQSHPADPEKKTHKTQ